MGHPQETTIREPAHFPTPTLSLSNSDHLRRDDGMAAIERGLAVLIPPVAAAAFAALKLLTQFCNLRSFTSKRDEDVTDIGKETKKVQLNLQ